jgi:hypothetical protein
VENKDKEITTDDISKMTTAEIIDELLFKSHFTTAQGPSCRCRTECLTHFLGMLPDKLCETSIEEIELSEVKDFETTVSSLCTCQRPHFFNIKLENGSLEYEVTDGRVCDPRKLRLPNF